MLTLRNANPGTDAAVAQFSDFPTLTPKNAVLLDPGLIDPAMGPVRGLGDDRDDRLGRFRSPACAGTSLNERLRAAATCIAGFISKRALMQTYGLSESQASEFFRRDTVVRSNVRVRRSYVQAAGRTSACASSAIKKRSGPLARFAVSVQLLAPVFRCGRWNSMP